MYWLGWLITGLGMLFFMRTVVAMNALIGAAQPVGFWAQLRVAGASLFGIVSVCFGLFILGYGVGKL